jgi:hypothetical protein
LKSKTKENGNIRKPTMFTTHVMIREFAGTKCFPKIEEIINSCSNSPFEESQSLLH